MPQSPIARRIIGAAYLVLTALIIAHATNAFVADALDAPTEVLHESGSAHESVDTSDPGASKQGVEDILTSGLFELPPTFKLSKNGELVSPPAPSPPPIEAARKVSLLGSVLGRDGGVLAVFEDVTSKEQQLYRLGKEIPNVGTLAVIEKDRVLFRSGPSEEWLALAVTQQPQSSAQASASLPSVSAQKGPMRRVLDRREVTAALNDPTRLMTHAQAVPYLTDGKLDGFRLYNVVSSGFFDKIGLQTSDIVQRINGVELRDPGMLLSLFQQLRNENTVRVDLVRNTQRQTLTYEIR